MGSYTRLTFPFLVKRNKFLDNADGIIHFICSSLYRRAMRMRYLEFSLFSLRFVAVF